jgi:hypothetical protein
MWREKIIYIHTYCMLSTISVLIIIIIQFLIIYVSSQQLQCQNIIIIIIIKIIILFPKIKYTDLYLKTSVRTSIMYKCIL